jgi:hypothetical protein
VPRIVDYSAVVAQAAGQGLVSLYPNSGAFGFPADVPTHAVGWVTGDDATLRPAARALAVVAPTPTPAGLAQLAGRAWFELLPGEVWVTPKAHWAYELDFGGPHWMPDLLRRAGVDPDALAGRHDGSAVSFGALEPEESERAAFVAVVDGLLANLLGSDFQLIFPGRDVVCTVHHHKQLWWTSPDVALIARLRGLVG